MANIEKKRKRLTEIKLARMNRGLYDEFETIAHTRFLRGLDKRPSPPTVQKKVLKHKLWPQLRNDLMEAEFIDDDKAQFSSLNIITFIVVAFLAVLLFGGLIYISGLLTNVFSEVGLQNEAQFAGNACFNYVNASDCSLNSCGWNGATCVPATYVNTTAAANATFGVHDNAVQALRLVAITLIMSIAISIIISNAMVKIHPAFFFVYVLVVLLGVFLAAPVANSYETLLNSNVYGGILPSFTQANWVLLNLPLVVAIVGIAGGIFLFLNMIRTGGDQALT